MADQLVVVALRVVFLAYVTLVLLHSSLERVYALRSRRQRRTRPVGAPVPASWPAVDVVIPCFNEDPSLLEACCRSVAGQDYPGTVRVWLVDDGSRNRAALLAVYERWADRGWDVRLLDRNVGKRAAQDEAVRCGTGDLVVLMDSDTVLAPDAIRQAAAAFADDQVGAVSGSIGVLNAPTNLLTRLIHHRYRLRFQVERPAQGFFTSLLCCSGPFAVYRRSLLAQLWQRYLGQTFAGVRCINGDDLHLTNLVLATGHQVLFEPRAVASTSVPRSLGQYLRQQLRWNRSFYRELRWTFHGVRSRHPYLALDVLARALLPLLLAVALLLLAGEGVLVGWELLAADLSLALAMLLVTAAFLLVHGASVPFLLLYGPLHVVLLVPVRVYALITLASPRWETR
ncbi:MAG TPA: glycosyltransferase [Actinomycetes bacterium]|jgi:N-acetylglucosaminyltransferase|nr:glycosyltransferase [Actinomycetes bacterium]